MEAHKVHGGSNGLSRPELKLHFRRPLEKGAQGGLAPAHVLTEVIELLG